MKILIKYFILFLFLTSSYNSAQRSDRNYFYKNIYSNNSLQLANLLNTQNKIELGPLSLDSIHTFSNAGSESKWFYNFDDNGRLNSKITKSYTDNIWDNYLYFTYEYDNNNLISILTKQWNVDRWENDMLEAYTYNIDGNASEYLVQLWINNEWENFIKSEQHYSSDGLSDTTFYYSWKDNVWTLDNRFLTSNLPNGKIGSFVYETWNDSNWVKYLSYVFVYNDDSNLINTVIAKWEGGNWIYLAQAIFEYDSSGNLIKELRQLWTENNWQDNEQYFFEYNSDNYFTYGRSEKWDGTKWVQNKGMFSFTNPDGFTEHLWTFEAKAYYSPTTAIKKENSILPNQFALYQNYPNPFNPSTTIKYSIPNVGSRHPANTGQVASTVQLRVYDILGHEVATLVNQQQKPGNYEVQFDASHFRSGIYFYKIQAGSFSDSEKMILLK